MIGLIPPVDAFGILQPGASPADYGMDRFGVWDHRVPLSTFSDFVERHVQLSPPPCIDYPKYHGPPPEGYMPSILRDIQREVDEAIAGSRGGGTYDFLHVREAATPRSAPRDSLLETAAWDLTPSQEIIPTVSMITAQIERESRPTPEPVSVKVRSSSGFLSERVVNVGDGNVIKAYIGTSGVTWGYQPRRTKHRDYVRQFF